MLLPFLLAIALLPVVSGECPQDFIRDGYCDTECNTLEHGWDGGDCCESTCQPDLRFDCGSNRAVGPEGYSCMDPSADSTYELEVQYEGFRLVMQCDPTRGAGYAKRYYYTLAKDTDDLGSKRSYKLDKRTYTNGTRIVPDECQQKSTKSYSREGCVGNRRGNPECYDRGHVVMANHVDNTNGMKRDAAYGTNLLPQATGFNQHGGAWRATEDLIECTRDMTDVQKLEIFGGIIYNDVSNDFFEASHGIPTPDMFYKVVVKHFSKPRPWSRQPTPEVIAWFMPNDLATTEDLLDKRYDEGGVLLSIARLVRLTRDRTIHDLLPAAYEQSAVAAGESWENPWGTQCTQPGFQPSSVE